MRFASWPLGSRGWKLCLRGYSGLENRDSRWVPHAGLLLLLLLPGSECWAVGPLVLGLLGGLGQGWAPLSRERYQGLGSKRSWGKFFVFRMHNKPNSNVRGAQQRKGLLFTRLSGKKRTNLDAPAWRGGAWDICGIKLRRGAACGGR